MALVYLFYCYLRFGPGLYTPWAQFCLLPLTKVFFFQENLRKERLLVLLKLFMKNEIINSGWIVLVGILYIEQIDGLKCFDSHTASAPPRIRRLRRTRDPLDNVTIEASSDQLWMLPGTSGYLPLRDEMRLICLRHLSHQPIKLLAQKWCSNIFDSVLGSMKASIYLILLQYSLENHIALRQFAVKEFKIESTFSWNYARK